MLLPENIKKYGYFDSSKTEILRKKMQNATKRPLTAREDMAVAAIISTQLLHYHFVGK